MTRPCPFRSGRARRSRFLRLAAAHRFRFADGFPAALAASGLLAFVVSGCTPRAADLTTFWAAHDAGNPASIPHRDWQVVLDGYLWTDDPSGIHLFDYRGLKANRGERARLQGYLTGLEAVDPRRYSRAEQMAYWINFYNALTVEVVVEAYPVDSIREIHRGVFPLSGPWGDIHATVAGQELTLDNMEHDILRALWKDPRIHYAVNCASLGCPNLLPQAYTADRLEAMLEEAARAYINHPRGLQVLDASRAVASSIYDWFREDFGGSEAGVRAHLFRYASPELAERLRNFQGRFRYEYDWSLNAAP